MAKAMKARGGSKGMKAKKGILKKGVLKKPAAHPEGSPFTWAADDALPAQKKPAGPIADTSGITPQQRHVFGKALKGLPGLPGSLPADIADSWRAATKPADRNAIVNALVDKDVAYGGDVKFDVETLIELRQTLKSSSDEKSAYGMTRTEMEAYLRGASQMELGLERGDVVEKYDGPI